MAERGDRVHPTYYSEISEPISPSERSTATGYSFRSNFQPLKAHTTPGYVSPARPPPTVVGRPIRVRHKGKGFRHCCRYCVITSCSVFFFLIFALGLAALIIWLVYKPRIPTYSVQDVQISDLNVTANYSQAQAVNQTLVNTDIRFTILAKNPNHKIKVDYKQVNIGATYQGSSVGKTSIPGWYQDVDNTTTIYADIHATNAILTASQGSALEAAIKSNSIPLQARIDVRAGIKIGGWKTPSLWVHVNCDFEVSPPSAPGGAKLLSKSCKWKWKNF